MFVGLSKLPWKREYEHGLFSSGILRQLEYGDWVIGRVGVELDAMGSDGLGIW